MTLQSKLHMQYAPSDLKANVVHNCIVTKGIQMHLNSYCTIKVCKG